MNTEREIRAAEQAILATEKKYREMLEGVLQLQNLLQLPAADKEAAEGRVLLLNELGAVPIIPVSDVNSNCPWVKSAHNETFSAINLEGQRYPRIIEATCLYRPARWQSIGRAINLQQQGFEHIFGISHKLGRKIGIYVKEEDEDRAVKSHVKLLEESYPSLEVSLDQITGLNLSPEFVYQIESRLGLTVPGVDSGRVNAEVTPVNYDNVVNSGSDPEAVPSYPTTLLELSPFLLSAFLRQEEKSRYWGNEVAIPLAEYVKNLLRSNYHVNYRMSGMRGGVEIYFDKVLSPKQIGEILELMGAGQDGHEIVLYRLSEQLRQLVNLPLENAKLFALVKDELDIEFKGQPGNSRRPQDGIYLPISMY